MPKHSYIEVKGARENNLKNIDVKIKHNSFTVITGVSGSGKSSLAFNTIFAEGQRRYVESLSSYARQFLGKFNKPEVDYIKGIAPAIAIQQKVISTNPRSTVGTVTEIYDYLKILYARIGKTFSPISGKVVKKHNVSDVLNFISSLDENEKIAILAPINSKKNVTSKAQIDLYINQGYSRIFDGTFILLNELSEKYNIVGKYLAIDRATASKDNDNLSRLADSIQMGVYEGNGVISVLKMSDNSITNFSTIFELDGQKFIEPSEQFFSFNTPYGACKKCEGFGSVININPNLVIPNKNLSLYEEAVVAWKGDKMKVYLKEFILSASKYNFPIHKPIKDLTNEQMDLLWNGNKNVYGIFDFFKFVESQAYKIQYRVMLARYRGKTSCPDCKTTRLRKDASYVKIGEKSIVDLVLMPINKLIQFFDEIQFNSTEIDISKRIISEIKNRLSYVDKVGLSYLTLNRAANTLSGGESQRINLATSLGSTLVGSMYILDEPSIGLHPIDNQNLIEVLKKLQNQGNTVIIVEHDEEIMKNADEIIDIGAKAGIFGGEVIFAGNYNKLNTAKNSLTANYLLGKTKIETKKTRRTSNKKIKIIGARENNLKDIEVEFPLNNFIGVVGVSGSGKTTLVKDILYPSLSKYFNKFGLKIGEYDSLTGDLEYIKDVIFVNQNPLGKSSRSTPASYVKAYDEIRELFSRQSVSKLRDYKPSYFSFNTNGGRCEMCFGNGTISVSMQFMADIELICENCNGTRFKEEVLEVKYQNKTIFDILSMSIDDAINFFEKQEKGKLEDKIIQKLLPLQKVGLGYLKLGQSSSTLSGGEAQRVKLASFLVLKNKTQNTFFIFDEPTTGLHFEDVKCLLIAFEELIEAGHTVLVIEHHMDIIKNVDYLIELGPNGGETGGKLIYSGIPEGLLNIEESPTKHYLNQKIKP